MHSAFLFAAGNERHTLGCRVFADYVWLDDQQDIKCRVMPGGWRFHYLYDCDSEHRNRGANWNRVGGCVAGRIDLRFQQRSRRVLFAHGRRRVGDQRCHHHLHRAGGHHFGDRSGMGRRRWRRLAHLERRGWRWRRWSLEPCRRGCAAGQQLYRECRGRRRGQYGRWGFVVQPGIGHWRSGAGRQRRCQQQCNGRGRRHHKHCDWNLAFCWRQRRGRGGRFLRRRRRVFCRNKCGGRERR